MSRPLLTISRSSYPEVFLGKGVLKICSKFTTCGSAISIKLQSSFIEITLRHICSLVHLLHIFKAPFLKNISGGLFLCFSMQNWLSNNLEKRGVKRGVQNYRKSQMKKTLLIIKNSRRLLNLFFLTRLNQMKKLQ